ncbi:MAG TPA: thiamine phosphate synthase [Thermoanaerobaculia bacterium]|nr:thiamine phosphate synthase [Thermoanaerobaculia bacterium]
MSVRGRPLPGPIYAIADALALAPMPVAAAVAEMAAAGVRSIQIRAKRWSGRQWHEAVEASCRALEGSGADLWLDDRADLAALFAAAGVRGLHVGQCDLPPAAARRALGDSPWIGLSTHNELQLIAADADPEVDLIAVGPVFPTTGKTRSDRSGSSDRSGPSGPPLPPDQPVGLEFVTWARSRTAKPLVAIGGIDASRVEPVLAAGADAVVALGAACRGDVRASCRQLVTAAEEAAAAWGRMRARTGNSEGGACGSS